MKKDVSIYLDDIVDSIAHIEHYTKNVQQDKFEEDEFLQDAVIRRFQVIGEAAKRIPDEFRKLHPDIPWRLATSLRDVLVHDYYEVKLERLWQTITEDLPLFKKQIEELLQKTS